MYHRSSQKESDNKTRSTSPIFDKCANYNYSQLLQEAFAIVIQISGSTETTFCTHRNCFSFPQKKTRFRYTSLRSVNISYHNVQSKLEKKISVAVPKPRSKKEVAFFIATFKIRQYNKKLQQQLVEKSFGDTRNECREVKKKKISLSEDHFPNIAAENRTGDARKASVTGRFESPAGFAFSKMAVAIFSPLALPRAISLFLSLYLFSLSRDTYAYITFFFFFSHSFFHTFIRGTRACIRSSSSVCSCV